MISREKCRRNLVGVKILLNTIPFILCMLAVDVAIQLSKFFWYYTNNLIIQFFSSFQFFSQKFNRLTINDRRKVFNVDMESILKKAATDIPCIGCRRCLDSLLGALRTLSPRAIPVNNNT